MFRKSSPYRAAKELYVSTQIEPFAPLVARDLIDFDRVRNSAACRNLLFLEKLSLREAWDVFLEELFNGRCNVFQHNIPWLETRIPELIAMTDAHDNYPYREFGIKLMDWYLGQSHGEQEIAAAALAFAVKLLRGNVLGGQDFRKKIFRHLAKNKLYWNVPSVDWFVRGTLRELQPFKAKNTYGESDWRLAEKAIYAIVGAEDVSMLPLLREIVSAHDEQKVGVHTHAGLPDRFLPLDIRAKLQNAVALLEQMKLEQHPSLTQFVGVPLAKAAGMQGGIQVAVGYVNWLTAASAKEGVRIFVGLACEHSGETPKLRQFLERAETLVVWPSWYRFETPSTFADRVNPNTLTMNNTFVPLVGTTSKFSLRFTIGNENLATYVGYVTVGEHSVLLGSASSKGFGSGTGGRRHGRQWPV